jgi:putative membrane protein
MRGKERRMALMAALSMALMAGVACARNSEDETTTGAVGTAQGDSAMGHRDTTQLGKADTAWSGQQDTTTMQRDTAMTPDTSSQTNPSSSQYNPPSPSTGSTTSPSTGSTTDPGTGSTTTSPNSSSSSSSSTSPNSSSSSSSSTTTPQASGPSAAGYSYEPSVAAPRAAATGAGQQQKLSDATILATLDRADMADSAAGAVAMQKAANPQVKDYGRMMTRDHHQSHVKVMQLAKALNISSKASNDDPISKTVTRDSTTLVSTPAGEQFDRTYIEQQIAMHKQVMEFAKQAEQSTTNAQIKQHIQETSPVLQRHLQRAEEIQQSLGRMPA